MQWLIDIIKEWADARFVQIPAFVNRGDPAAVDYDKTTLTQDGAWHELDLSAIVPENAKGASLILSGTNGGVQRKFIVRRHGNANERVIGGFSTLTTWILHYADVTCAVDTDRKIDYLLSTVGWASCDLTVKSWWF